MQIIIQFVKPSLDLILHQEIMLVIAIFVLRYRLPKELVTQEIL